MKVLFRLLLVLPFVHGCTAPVEMNVDIIPVPVSMEASEDAYKLRSSSGFLVQDASLEGVAQFFSNELSQPTGYVMAVSGTDGDIVLALDSSLDPESYRLSVSGSGVEISAGDEAGAFYALQSMRQMLPPEIEYSHPTDKVEWILPGVDIEDSPRFPYRGLHLDVGRYFFDVDFVKRYIDTMARYKFNTFHWHLTEDQGWRIEINKYPRLTEIGAWRKETIVEKNFDPYIGDGIPHGGFYTQEQIREVVAYAAERFITVIPEIEMPGHATAAIASYPEYGCTQEPLEVLSRWGVMPNLFCPTEETFSFLQDVLSEVMDLFPSSYIHIGADEATKDQWKESAIAQSVMRREGLSDENDLQSYFIRRIEAFLNDNGRNLIGWDEILEGGLAPNATVMSWRGMEGGIEAAQHGHDVIMTPTDYTYFDFYQGDPETEPLAMNWANRIIPLDTVYAFDPMPPSLSEAESQHILGAQANVWTEYISTPEYVEYMVYPRAIALSEVVWSPVSHRNIDSFYERLSGNLPHLEMLGVNYRIPERLDARMLDLPPDS